MSDKLRHVFLVLAGMSTMEVNVSRHLSSYDSCLQMSSAAAEMGFDWVEPIDALAKVEEEIGEIQSILLGPVVDDESLTDEVGDLLFAALNVARKLNVDPAAALEAANRKFARRFAYIQETLAQLGLSVEEVELDELERIWQEAKRIGPG
jgi:nucleoside triphosphate diphosphatase